MPLSGAVQEIVFAGYVHGSATGLDGDGHLVLYSRVREILAALAAVAR